MTINLKGEVQEVQQGLENLLANFNFPSLYQQSLAIEVTKLTESDNVSLKVSTKNGLHLAYKEISNFFRALSLLLQNKDKIDYEKEETAVFSGCSLMIDCSRNAVYTVEHIKRMLSYMALAGHNRCYLYMEDTYELLEYPYFGYLRGRYSKEELCQIVDFADSLGIETIPCIQTLAHLKTTLKWDYASSMKDADDVLMVGEEETYRFIDAMISTLKSIFHSKYIHIGMDEAMNLGTGRYLRYKGYRSQYELMMEHLHKVNEIVQKHGLVPMIWDDMFYRALNKEHEYYDPNCIPTKEDIAQVPENVKLVFWDYYHDTEEIYDQLLDMRDKFPNEIVFAGGIWRWMGYIPNYSKTFVMTNAAIKMCKKHNVEEIMATAWGDDGSECPLQTLIPGIILFGEHCFNQPTDEDSIDERCKFLTGVSLHEFEAIEKIDILPGCENPNLKTRNPSKQIIFQDILLGAFDSYFDKPELPEYYQNCKKELLKISAHAGKFENLFKMYASFADVLSDKVCIGINLRKAYKANDKEYLKQACDTILPRLKGKVAQFKADYAKIWFSESKGHGFEVLDVRFGGLMGRIDTIIERLSLYLSGNIDKIEELEEEILPFKLGACGFAEGPYASYNMYSNIVTENILAW